MSLTSTVIIVTSGLLVGVLTTYPMANNYPPMNRYPMVNYQPCRPQPWYPNRARFNNFPNYNFHFMNRYPYWSGHSYPWNVDMYMRNRPHIYWRSNAMVNHARPQQHYPYIQGRPNWFLRRFDTNPWHMARAPLIGQCRFVGHGVYYSTGPTAVLVANFPPGGTISHITWEKLAGSEGCIRSPNYCHGWTPIHCAPNTKFINRPCGKSYHGHCNELTINAFDPYRDSGYYRARGIVNVPHSYGPQSVFVDVKVCPTQRRHYSYKK